MTTVYREQNDEALVRLAQGGDTRAFDELVVRYRDKVYRLALRILRHEEDAAEALQEAFLSAYRGLKNFRKIHSSLRLHGGGTARIGRRSDARQDELRRVRHGLVE